MYKASIRALLRHSIKKLNGGDYSLMLKMADPDFELAFPGENSWATMFRPRSADDSVTSPTEDSTRPPPSPTVSSARASSFRSRTSSSTGPRGTPASPYACTISSPATTKRPTCTTTERCSFSNSAGGVCSGGRTTRTPSAWRHGSATERPRRERQRDRHPPTSAALIEYKPHPSRDDAFGQDDHVRLPPRTQARRLCQNRQERLPCQSPTSQSPTNRLKPHRSRWLRPSAKQQRFWGSANVAVVAASSGRVPGSCRERSGIGGRARPVAQTRSPSSRRRERAQGQISRQRILHRSH